MEVAYLALGSNLGDRELFFKKAIRYLRQEGTEVIRCASIYETEPKDVTDQPWFLNTVLEIQTALRPRDLLNLCLSIETENLRVRSLPKSARTLDMDILFYGNHIIHEDGLTVPHPRLAQRNFVLVPLAEIAPAFVDPVSGRTIGELMARSSDTATIRPIASGQQFLDSSL